MNALDDLGVGFDPIEPLVDGMHARLSNQLSPDNELFTAALCGQRKKRRIFPCLDARLTTPPYYGSPREARQGIANYMHFSNHERPHQARDYRCPWAVSQGACVPSAAPAATVAEAVAPVKRP